MRGLHLSLITVAAVLVTPALASASTPVLTVAAGGDYTLAGTTGADDLTIAPAAGGKISFTVVGSTITSPGVPCTPTAATVTCTPAQTYSSVTVNADNGADKVLVSGDLANHSVTFYGGDGDDQLTGNVESDRFYPGPGGDTIDGGPALPSINPGVSPGTDARSDSLDYQDATLPVLVTFDGIANDGPAGDNDNLIGGIENVHTGGKDDIVNFNGLPGNHGVSTGSGNDQIIGSDGNDEIGGGDGNDNISGGPGNDYIYSDDSDPGDDRVDGGAGDDTIVAGGGNDVEIGGPGDDVFNQNYQPDYGSNDVSGGDGEDEAWVVRWEEDRFGSPTTPGGGLMLLARSLRVATPPVPQPVFVSLDDVANDGRGGETTNIHSDIENVRTGDGDDTISGSASSNTLYGGIGNDTIDPGAGADDVQGEAGDDRISVKDTLADKANCGEGNDTVAADEGVDALFSCEVVTRTALPVAPAPPRPDTTKPAVTKLSGVPTSITRKSFTKSGLKLTVTTSEAASVGAELFAALSTGKRFGFAAAVNDLQIGSGKLKLGTGARKLTLKPGLKWKSRTKNRKLRLTVRLTLTDAAGNVAVVTKKVRVK